MLDSMNWYTHCLLYMSKEIDSWLLAFSNQYVKSTYKSEMALMSKRIKELEESEKKWQNRANKLHRQIIDLSAKQTKIICPTATSTSATQVVLHVIVFHQ